MMGMTRAIIVKSHNSGLTIVFNRLASSVVLGKAGLGEPDHVGLTQNRRLRTLSIDKPKLAVVPFLYCIISVNSLLLKFMQVVYPAISSSSDLQ
jgi:hypothetical protein